MCRTVSLTDLMCNGSKDRITQRQGVPFWSLKKIKFISNPCLLPKSKIFLPKTDFGSFWPENTLGMFEGKLSLFGYPIKVI